MKALYIILALAGGTIGIALGIYTCNLSIGSSCILLTLILIVNLQMYLKEILQKGLALELQLNAEYELCKKHLAELLQWVYGDSKLSDIGNATKLKLDEAFLDGLKGRYNNHKDLLSGVTLTNISTDTLLPKIEMMAVMAVKGHKDFKVLQEKLLKLLEQYEECLVIKNKFVEFEAGKQVGLPTNMLRADTKFGQAALDVMYRVVLDRRTFEKWLFHQRNPIRVKCKSCSNQLDEYLNQNT